MTARTREVPRHRTTCSFVAQQAEEPIMHVCSTAVNPAFAKENRTNSIAAKSRVCCFLMLILYVDKGNTRAARKHGVFALFWPDLFEAVLRFGKISIRDCTLENQDLSHIGSPEVSQQPQVSIRNFRCNRIVQYLKRIALFPYIIGCG